MTDEQKQAAYLDKQWNTAGPEISRGIQEEEELRRRAFWVKLLTVVFLVLDLLCILICTGVILANELYNYGPELLLGALLAFVLLCIPVLVQYYLLNSIAVSLRTSADLHGEIEKLRKMLEDRTKQ